MAGLKKNIFYLVLVQAANYVFPLITLPYLGRVLEPENFGALAFCQAVILYLMLVVDYGFNLSATRLVSIHRTDKKMVSEIFISTIYAKLFLLLLSFIILFGLILFVPKLHTIWPVIVASSIGIIGNALFPLWLFQGLERMELLVIVSTVAKLILIILTFSFVHTSEDVALAGFLQNSGQMLAAIIGVVIIWRHKLIYFVKPTMQNAKAALIDGWPMFISGISISFYTTFNTLLLGMTGTHSQVAFYSTAERLRLVSQGVISPISQAIYPRMSAATHHGDEDGERLFKLGGYLIAGISLLFSIAMLFFSDPIIKIYLGNAYSPAAQYLKKMFLLPIIIAGSIIWGQWGLMAMGEGKLLSKLYIAGAILHVLYTGPLIYFYGVTGLIIAVTLTEAIIVAFMIYFYERNKFRLGKIV